MGKNNSKRKPVTHYQQFESIMRKLDNELKKEAEMAKKLSKSNGRNVKSTVDGNSAEVEV